jgi:hypothetical protein
MSPSAAAHSTATVTVLGIETSCDETAAAVLDADGRILAEAVYSQLQEHAPFGGVGASGMGHYHGREGFMEFSHARSIYSAGAHDPRREWGMLPPYNDGFVQMIKGAVAP